MFSRLFQFGGALMFGAVVLAEAASACIILVSAGGPDVTLASGNSYTDSPIILGTGVDISNQYNFTSSGLSSTSTAVALNSNPPAQQSNFGIKDLRLEWFDNSNTT